MNHHSATNGQRIEEAAPSMGENVANLAADLVSLGELQVKLLLLDLQEGSGQVIRTAAIFLCGSCLLLGAIPVLLLGLGGLLSSGSSLSLPTAWLLVAVMALMVSSLSLWQAVRQLRRSSAILLRSRTELQENITWIKRVIRQSTSGSK